MIPFNTPWQEKYLFIKVAFFGWEILLKSQVSKIHEGPWNWGMDFLVAWITFSMDILIALNNIAWV